jgi:hypothetical protein
MPNIFTRHKLPTILGVIILAPILVLALWITITLSYTYSSGDRAGTLQKFSSRGWICKTWRPDRSDTSSMVLWLTG